LLLSFKKEDSCFLLFWDGALRKRFYRCLLALSVSACSPASLLNSTISRAGLTVTHDVAYGALPRQKLDIYRPDGAGPAPVVVFFYGGSWNSGNKAMYPFVAATLARQGNVVVVPDYRLYPQVRFPAFLHDCAKAVAWTLGHVREIGGDPDRVFLMGHSAGAYNAVMLGLDPAYLAAAGTSRANIAGVIGLAGPYDFLPITGEDVKAVFATVGDGPASQPITYVDGKAPPMLLLAGSADTTVLPRNTLSLAAKLRAKGGQVEDRIFPGVAHIGLVIAIAPLFQGKAPVLPSVEAFIRSHRLNAAAGAGAQAAE
jgi:acetyl esterase/lipase